MFSAKEYSIRTKIMFLFTLKHDEAGNQESQNYKIFLKYAALQWMMYYIATVKT
jgi:hypothetical protein